MKNMKAECIKSKRAQESAHIARFIQAKRHKRDLITHLESHKAQSAWKRGVRQYALELVESAETPLEPANLRETLLNGADDWKQYSQGGLALIYDCDIAQRLFTPSELKRKRGGALPPNSKESWLDVQARALWQAEMLIGQILRRMEPVAA